MDWKADGPDGFAAQMRREKRDELTGLSTMMAFMEQAERALRDGPAAFLYFNVENFRLVNQRSGFQVGNQVLVRIAQALSDAFGAVPMARLNDDRFVVMTRMERLEERLETILEQIAAAGGPVALVLKVGVYTPEAGRLDVAGIMDRAKLACDSIKGIYDRDIAFFDVSMEERQSQRAYIVTHFYQALEKGWIEVFYQPEVRAATRKICGMEALARWRDPERGLISPGIFIPVLEEAHLIDKLDLHVLHRVCEDLESARLSGAERLTHVSVNLSRVDFQLTDVLREVESILSAYGVPRHFLHLEITESALSGRDAFLKKEILRLREAGFELWMDDFGSGYSSLNNLKDFAFDVVKIDMAFLRDFEAKPQTRVILSAIVDMSKKLGLHTLAEGVETEEQYDFLKSIGCEVLQGYLFSPPAPLAELRKLSTGEKAPLPIEDFQLAEYYMQIGKFNVLSSQPVGDLSADAFLHEAPAVGVLEVQGKETRALYRSQAMRDFEARCGFDGEQAAQHLLDSYDRGGYPRLSSLVRRALSSGRMEVMEGVIGGNVFSMQMQEIARDEAQNRVALVYQLIDLSSWGHHHQERSMDLVIRHLLQIYTRLDIFTVDGRAENLMVDASQQRVMDVDEESVSSLTRYAERYIVPEEREAFLRFYDVASIVSRAKQARNPHISAFFHVRDELTGEIETQIFIIVPFRLAGKWHYLSAVRRLDGLDAKHTAQLKLTE